MTKKKDVACNNPVKINKGEEATIFCSMRDLYMLPEEAFAHYQSTSIVCIDCKECIDAPRPVYLLSQ